jgi:hypothetical protein
LNTEINSTLRFDLATEDQLATIARKVTEVEKDIQIMDNDIRRNITDGQTKANKSLKKRKRKLTLRKSGLAKQ